MVDTDLLVCQIMNAFYRALMLLIVVLLQPVLQVLDWDGYKTSSKYELLNGCKA